MVDIGICVDVVPLSGPCLASMLPKKIVKSDKSLTSALSTLYKCFKRKNTHCLLSMILCSTSISQNLISQCNIIPLNSTKSPTSFV